MRPQLQKLQTMVGSGPGMGAGVPAGGEFKGEFKQMPTMVRADGGVCFARSPGSLFRASIRWGKGRS